MAVQAPPKKTRGPTKCSAIWDIKDPRDRIRVEINGRGQPIGDKACSFTRFLGTIARKGNLVPIDYSSWHDVPNINKDHMWGIVQEKIVFFPVEAPSVKGFTLRNIGDKWRGWKGNLKDKYYDEISDVDIIAAKASKENKVEQTQFKNLMNRWRTDKEKTISATNALNRSKHDEPHITGTKSFARVAAEMAKKLKRQPYRSEVYVKTRKREDGTFVSEKAREVVEKIDEIHSEEAISEEETSILDDVLAKAQNKPEQKGREKCAGMLPPSSERRIISLVRSDSSISQLANQELKEQYEQMKGENAQMKEKLNWMTELLKSVSEKVGVSLDEFPEEAEDA